MPLARRIVPAARTLVVALLLALPASRALARALPSELRPQPIAPLGDATVSESGLTFAWTPAPGTTEHWLFVARHEFDPSAWTSPRAAADVRAVRAERPVVDWSTLGEPLDQDARLWWAAADRDPATGRFTVSEVRTVYALRRFSNRAEQSPLVAVSPVAAAPAVAGGVHRVRLAAGYTIDPRLGEPALPAGQRLSAAPAPGARRAYLVYFGDADPAETRRAILASGAQVVAYVPDRTFLVRTPPGGSLTFGTPGAWIGAWQPAYKKSPRLAAGAAGKLTVTALLFPDADLPAVATAARAAGARVLASSANGLNKVLRLELPAPAIDALAQHDDVAWIEPFVPASTSNQFAQGIVQTGVVGNRRLWDLGLKGEGQVVMTSDSGIDTHHIAIKDPLVPINDFGSYPSHRKLIEYDRASADAAIVFGDHGSYHGSHTAGTVAGNNDALGTSPNDGMAKNAKLWFVDLSGPTLGTSLDTPPDLNDLYQPSYTGNGGGVARIASNSWGSDVAGAYTVESMTIDQFSWNHPDYLIFFANGNAGTSGAMTVGSPATAKDCVSVGATGNNGALNSFATFSSRGPTVDGRLKPDICAPGSGVTSSTIADSTYATLSGTSMATPAAAGCTALIRQYLTEGWYPTGAKVAGNAFTPSAALLKALVVNSGNNMISGPVVPDNNVGWGRIDADSVLYFAGDTRRLLLVDQTAGLGNGQYVDYTINVTDGSIPLKVSVVWQDFPGSPVAAVQLVNDLDLTVTKGATVFIGNRFSNGLSVSGNGPRDSLNTIECTRIASPATGLWTVRVAAHSVPAGPQPYALVITGGLGTTAGALALDRASYGSTASVQLRVTDTNASSPVAVNIASTTEPAGEPVSLTGANGVFTGSIALSPFAGTVGDGVLRVSNGDAITATYNDASPVATIVAKAQVAIEPPTITGVYARGAGPRGVTVLWTTDVNATSRVDYGVTPDLGQSTPLDSLSVLSHAVAIDGLSPNQTYWFDVESTDLNGNVTRDDNGGAHYRFTPGRQADLLLVYDGSSFEQATRYTSALAALGWTYDLWAGSQSATPLVGDVSSGMRAYRAVWWQNGIEHYPPFSDPAIDSVTAYMNGGGRLAVTGHDVAWANGDQAGSPYWTATRANFLSGTLHTTWLVDPTTWNGLTGVAADPVSGAYSGGVSYTPARSGAAGDEVGAANGAGSSSYDWISGSTAPDHCGFRWESSGSVGTLGSGVYGGMTSRLLTNYFEWSYVDPANSPSSAIRNDILRKSIAWLIGHDKPSATLTAPNGGEVLTGNSVNVTWTESSSAGISARSIEYSVDNGSSWTFATVSAGPSPYVLNLTSIPNTSQALVRVRVTDAGSPTLSAEDVSNATFAIARPGGDVMGPVVVAGTIHATPDPIDNTQPATVTATVTDVNGGGAAVTQAEWSFGDIPAPAGSGHAMTGVFGTPTVGVSAALTTSTFVPGMHRLWVRGRDSAGNWGAAGSLAILVNGAYPVTGVDGLPREYSLAAGVPNPAATSTHIRYALPAGGRVDLSVYDVGGRRVRTLVAAARAAGWHDAEWNLRDDAGTLVSAGVYYYRLEVAGRTFTRRLVALN